MLEISKNANPNYLCKVVQLKGLKKHPNADRLQMVTIDFNNVITGLDAKEGDTYVYFPIESKISRTFLSFTNSFRDKTFNEDPNQVGFFEDNCRVKAMKLRGEKSMGYLVPMNQVYAWAFNEEVGSVFLGSDYTNQEFDTINNLKLVEKYQIPIKGGAQARQGKKPKVSRLVEGQVHLHIDTENLRKNAHKVRPTDLISITYKTHGTSWWVANVLVKRKLSLLERLLKKLGILISDMEYDLVYGSRKVVKNAELQDPKAKDHFFGYDLWEDIKNQVGEYIPKGWTLYGEMLGFDKNGKAIQAGFDYGCGTECGSISHKLEVYRITNTTPDGLVTELSYPEIKNFCDKVGLQCSHLFFYGHAGNWYNVDYTIPLEEWSTNFIKKLEEAFNEKDCFMCSNKVPEEGVVVRVEDLFECKSYKLKSFRFLEFESKELDKGVSDIESEN
jgi:hypothetical protein